MSPSNGLSTASAVTSSVAGMADQEDKTGKSKTRMAGEALEDLSAEEDNFRNNLERRIGTEEYDRLSRGGIQLLDDGNRMTAREVISEFRERPEGVKVNEGEDSMVSRYQNMVDSGTRFNAKARKYLKGHGVDFSGNIANDPVTNPEPDPIEESPSTVISAPAPTPITSTNNVTFGAPGTAPGVDDVQQIAQDNDIYSTVYGNGNQVAYAQDNRINGYRPSRITTDFLSNYNFFG